MSAIKNLQSVVADHAGLDDHEGQPSGEPHHSRPQRIAPEVSAGALAVVAAGDSLPGVSPARGTDGTGAGVLAVSPPQTPDLYHGGQNTGTGASSQKTPILLDDEIGIDWLSITSEVMVSMHEVQAFLDAVESGPSRPSKAFQGFQRADTWPSGATLLWGHSSGRWWLSVDGSACAILGGSVLHRLARVAMMGGTCKRIDIRRDMRGLGLTLIDDLDAACKRLELCHLKQSQRMPKMSADGVLLGDGIYLGSRSSARFVRCYDKGLETETAAAGEWVRFEVQLRDDFAHEAACAIFGATPDRWPAEAMKRLIGVADFRVGRVSGRALYEFDQPAFWRAFCEGGEAVRGDMVGKDVDADRWMQAVRDQYGGVLALAAEKAGISLGQMAEMVFSGSMVTAGTRKNPVVPKLVQAVDELEREHFFLTSNNQCGTTENNHGEACSTS